MKVMGTVHRRGAPPSAAAILSTLQKTHRTAQHGEHAHVAACRSAAVWKRSTLGCEQEYFILDRVKFLARPDLLCSGRTLQARERGGLGHEDRSAGTQAVADTLLHEGSNWFQGRNICCRTCCYIKFCPTFHSAHCPSALSEPFVLSSLSVAHLLCFPLCPLLTCFATDLNHRPGLPLPQELPCSKEPRKAPRALIP